MSSSWSKFILALAMSVPGLILITVGGCSDSDVATDTAQQCSAHTDCPPSQVCESHSCTAICLTGVLCPAASEQGITGSVSLTEYIAANSTEAQVVAQAAFQHAENLITADKMYFPGSDCVAVPSQQLSLPSGLDVGPIALSGGLTSNDIKSAADSGQGTAQVFPENKDEGAVYYADLSQGLRLSPEKTVSAKTFGNDSLPSFEAKVSVPRHFVSIQVEPASVVAGQPYLVKWTPDEASQVLVYIHGIKTTDQGDVPVTILCPARDESGQITVPWEATSMLAKSPVSVSLVRHNVIHSTTASGTIFAKAGFSYSWTADVL